MFGHRILWRLMRRQLCMHNKNRNMYNPMYVRIEYHVDTDVYRKRWHMYTNV